MGVVGLVDELLFGFAGYLRKHPQARTRIIWICLTILLLVALGMSSLSVTPVKLNGIILKASDLTPFIVAVLLPTIILLSVAVVSFGDLEKLRNSSGDLKATIDILGLSATIGRRKTRKTRVNGAAKSDDKANEEAEDILDAIRLNLAQVVEYYVINKGQARRSFQMSVSAIIVGFMTIIAGIWLSYTENVTNQSPAYISVLAGVVLQFIGGAYFYLYNRSLIQLNFFFSRLALMQDTMLAIRLSDSIPEGAEKHRVLEKLIFLIVSRDSKVPQYLAEPPEKNHAPEKPTAPPKGGRATRAAAAT